MKTKQQITALVAFSLLVLPACASIDEAQELQEASTPITPASQVDPQAIEKINTLFSLSPSAQQAKEVAIARCVESKGYEWPAATQLVDDFDVRELLFPYPLTQEEAQQAGYAHQQAPKAGANMPEEVSEEAMDAYMGNPSQGSVTVEGIPGAIAANGCLAQAYQEVFGSKDAGVLFEGGINNLPLPYIGAAVEDSRMQELDNKWSLCMKNENGIDVESPSLAAIDTSMDSHTMAMADAACREAVNYEEETRKILNAYLTTFLVEKEGMIDQLTQAKKEAEKKAPEILGK